MHRTFSRTHGLVDEARKRRCIAGLVKSHAADVAEEATPAGRSAMDLSIALTSAVFQRGESIVILVKQRFDAPATTSPIEWNADDTQIFVMPTDGRAPRKLTGFDAYVRGGSRERPTYPVPTPIPAGAAWSSVLHLYNYTTPLAPGSYRLAVRFRYGPEPADFTRSNAVTFRVQ